MEEVDPLSNLSDWFRALGTEGLQRNLARIEEGGGEPVLVESDEHEGASMEGQRTHHGLMARFIAAGGEEASMRVFEANADRPEGYPADLPFVPHAKAMTCVASTGTRERGIRVVMWTGEGEGEADEILKAVVNESVKIGWTVASEGGRRTRLVSEDRERMVSHMPMGAWPPPVLLFEFT
ncbi:hypothetical protein [Candidatus Palauibacter sp.]|uniref:hypothetical protein n=1 Tax=Candidatus Palauibacter sp. TaxID=3101350 RepID=UPI003B5C8632